MAIARLNKEYALRFCAVALIFIGLSLWSLYDGLVAWPKANRSLEQLRKMLVASSSNEKGVPPEVWLAPSAKNPDTFLLREIFENENLSLPAALAVKLKEITHPEGNSEEAVRERALAAAKVFEEDVYPPQKIRGQYIQAFLAFAFSAVLVFSVAAKINVRYISDDEGIRESKSGLFLKWQDMKKVDWSKWKEKGIIRIQAQNGKTLVLDGWHFKGVKDIASDIGSHFPEDGNA